MKRVAVSVNPTIEPLTTRTAPTSPTARAKARRTGEPAISNEQPRGGDAEYRVDRGRPEREEKGELDGGQGIRSREGVEEGANPARQRSPGERGERSEKEQYRVGQRDPDNDPLAGP